MKTFITLALIIGVGIGVWFLLDSYTAEAPAVQPAEHALIRVSAPLTGAQITSPLSITGEARGYWFFEASFPIVLVDWDGLIITEGVAQAEGEWMTEDFVPFVATLTFSAPINAPSNNGTLILKKDNPSGLPEHDDALEIPVTF